MHVNFHHLKNFDPDVATEAVEANFYTYEPFFEASGERFLSRTRSRDGSMGRLEEAIEARRRRIFGCRFRICRGRNG